MVSRGEAVEMKRDNPKSVSLIRGREGWGRAESRSEAVGLGGRLSKGLTVKRMSASQLDLTAPLRVVPLTHFQA